jgi:hypothetical protein
MAHSVSVSWGASPDASLFGAGDGYVVFKGTAAGSESTQLTPTPITALAFTDTTAEPGNEFYAVKASIGGVLSAFSNSVEAVILPAAPVNLVLGAVN